jgi:hypothetical protein
MQRVLAAAAAASLCCQHLCQICCALQRAPTQEQTLQQVATALL